MMTYEEFLERITKMLARDFTFDPANITFYPKGARGDDPKTKDLIREVNLELFGQEEEALLDDFLFLKHSEWIVMRVPAGPLYSEYKECGIESVIEDLRSMKTKLEQLEQNTGLIRARVLADYEDIRKDLVLRPMNYAKHFRKIKDSVYRRTGDVALVLCLYLGETEDSLTTSVIHKEELENWGMADRDQKVLQEALENTSRIFPPCIYDNQTEKKLDFMRGAFTREDITSSSGQILLSTFRDINGAAALFYPGVVDKMMKIMGGPFFAVFINTADVMIFEMDDPRAFRYAQVAARPNGIGEVLSGKLFRCDESGIRVEK